MQRVQISTVQKQQLSKVLKKTSKKQELLNGLKEGVASTRERKR